MCGMYCAAINNDAKYQAHNRIRRHKLSRLADSTQRDNDSSSCPRSTRKNYEDTNANHRCRKNGHRSTRRRAGCQFSHPVSDADDRISEGTQRHPAARHCHYRCRRGFAGFPRPVQRSESDLSIHNPQPCIPFRAPAE